jgi:hypothetical protein
MSTTFPVTDSRATRARNMFADLPVADQDAAAQLADRPVEPGSDVEVYEPQTVVPERTYDLGVALKFHFGEFLRYHSQKKEATEWTTQFKKLLPPVVGKSSLLVVGDRPVATFRNNGALSMSLLAREQPEIIKKYTRLKWTEVFDKDAFAAEMPHIYEAYRARRFVLVTNGSAAGLTLPQ